MPVVEEAVLKGALVETRLKLNRDLFDLDKRLEYYQSRYQKDTNNVRTALIQAFAYQHVIEKEIEKSFPQYYNLGKVLSLEKASQIGLEHIANSESESFIFRDVADDRKINLEAAVPDPVNEVLRLYLTALKRVTSYGGDLEDTTKEFFTWLQEKTTKLEQEERYSSLNVILKKDPIIIGKRKFDKCDNLEFTQSTELSELRWDGIGGYEEQKHILMRLSKRVKELDIAAQYSKNPIPRGLLMIGPSGTGKTLMARTFASQSGLPYEFVKAASIGSPFVNETANKWQKIFDKVAGYVKSAAANGAVLIVDEIDTVCPDRKFLKSGEDSKVNRVFFENMDGSLYVPGVMVMAATNRAYILDPALLSRFTRIIDVGLPNKEQREAVYRTILGQCAEYARDAECLESVFMKNIDYKKIAGIAEDFSCRNIRDTVDGIVENNLDDYIEIKQKIKPITTAQILAEVEEYKARNQLKIQKNLQDHQESLEYVKKMAK